MSKFNIDIDATTAMDQAGSTAHDYYMKARTILASFDDDFTSAQAIELAKVMAQDFHTSAMTSKLQELTKELLEIDMSLLEMRDILKASTHER